MATATDFFTQVGNPGTATTLAAPGHTIGGTTFNVVSTSNWPTTTGAVFAVDNYTLQTVNGVPNTPVRTPGTYTEWEGIVSSGTQITSGVLLYGTDQNYSAGSLTRVYIPVASSRENRLVQGLISAGLTQAGGMGAISPTSVASTGAVSGTTGTFSSDVSDNSVTLKTIRSESSFDYVVSGGAVLTGTGLGSTLGWNLTAGVVYIGGKRLTVTAATGTVTASKDTYFDLLDPGTGTVATLVNTSGNIVNNNATSPTLAASSVRLGIVVSGTTIAAAASVNQGQEDRVLPIVSSQPYTTTDGLGNLIYPTDPNRKTLGYKQIIGNVTATTQADVAGLTCPVIVPAGRKVKIVFDAQSMSINVASGAGSYGAFIQEGATQLAGVLVTSKGSGFTDIMHREAEPPSVSSGSHTYKIQTVGNAGTATLTAASNSPAFIKVELV